MKRLIVLSAFSISAFSVASAQQAPPPAHEQPIEQQHKKEMLAPTERAAKRAERMTKELGLTAEQKVKVQTTLQNFFSKQDALHSKKEAMDKDAFRKERKVIDEERDNAFKTILSAEQFAKLKEKMEAEKDKRKGEEHQQTPAPPQH